MAASLEHLRALEAAIGAVRNLSDEIVDGGALYVAGLPELAQNLNEDLLWASIMLEVLSLRQSERASSLGVSQLWASLFGGDN